MLSENIKNILEKNSSISLKKVMAETHESLFGFLLALLALPSALPVPAPGYSTPFGIVIILLALQIIIGRKNPWFPSRIKEKEVPLEKFKKGISTINKFIIFFEKFIHPRLSFVYTQGFPIIGITLLLCGLCMLLPIPGTNTIPALGVFIISIGMIEKDGILGILGMLVSLVGITITAIILYLGKEFLDLILTKFF